MLERSSNFRINFCLYELSTLGSLNLVCLNYCLPAVNEAFARCLKLALRYFGPLEKGPSPYVCWERFFETHRRGHEGQTMHSACAVMWNVAVCLHVYWGVLGKISVSHASEMNSEKSIVCCTTS